MSLRAVLFDAVGTVLHPRPNVAEAYLAAGHAFGSRLDLLTIKHRFRAALAAEEGRDAARNQRTDEAIERDRWQRIVAAVFDDVSNCEPIFAQLWQHFAAARHWQFDERAADLFSSLREQSLRLALASNFDSRLRGICRETPALASLDAVFVSSEIGWRKPGPKFFSAVAEQLQLAPEELLLVGDDLTNDYRAARAAGWQALWLSDQPTDHVPEFDRVASLEQVVAAIALR